MNHEELLSHVLNQYNGTPEEFGELLHDATMTVPEWSSKTYRTELVQRKSFARSVIQGMDGGRELIEKEQT